jgi:hypothetical protein
MKNLLVLTAALVAVAGDVFAQKPTVYLARRPDDAREDAATYLAPRAPIVGLMVLGAALAWLLSVSSSGKDGQDCAQASKVEGLQGKRRAHDGPEGPWLRLPQDSRDQRSRGPSPAC